jgi:hypothetical protein
MFDDLLMLIDGDSDGSLTTTGTYSGVEVDESPVSGLTFEVRVPAAASTTTLDIDIQQADTDADGSYATIASFPQITAAASKISIGAYVWKDYVRASVSVAGTSPDFGAVSLGIVPNVHRFANAQ